MNLSFQGSSKDVKESWVAEIRKLLVEQLNSAKGITLSLDVPTYYPRYKQEITLANRNTYILTWLKHLCQVA